MENGLPARPNGRMGMVSPKCKKSGTEMDDSRCVLLKVGEGKPKCPTARSSSIGPRLERSKGGISISERAHDRADKEASKFAESGTGSNEPGRVAADTKSGEPSRVWDLASRELPGRKRSGVGAAGPRREKLRADTTEPRATKSAAGGDGPKRARPQGEGAKPKHPELREDGGGPRFSQSKASSGDPARPTLKVGEAGPKCAVLLRGGAEPKCAKSSADMAGPTCKKLLMGGGASNCICSRTGRDRLSRVTPQAGKAASRRPGLRKGSVDSGFARSSASSNKPGLTEPQIEQDRPKRILLRNKSAGSE